jgi:hypothetical protein
MEKKKKKTKASRPAPVSKSTTTDSDEKKGEALFNQLVKLTGIPSQAIKKELKTILEKKNIDIDHLTLDQLRVVVASYVREIMGGILEKYHLRRTDSH